MESSDPRYCGLTRNNEHSFDKDGICKCGVDVCAVLDELGELYDVLKEGQTT